MIKRARWHSRGYNSVETQRMLMGSEPPQRTLGRIATASGAFLEAETYFTKALQTYVACQAQQPVALMHLECATLAHARENPEATATHPIEAHTRFGALQAPGYVEHTEQLAWEFGIDLASRLTRRRPAQTPSR